MKEASNRRFSVEHAFNSLIRVARDWFYRRKKNWIAKKTVAMMERKRIIVGAGGTSSSGWLQTDKDTLNIVSERDWARLFDKNSLDAILAEHVWEHLTNEEAILAAVNCFVYLRPEGTLRIAVPDGYHCDINYIEQVRPSGSGPGADDHKELYNYHTLSSFLKEAGYQVKLLEWFDERGNFHHEDWDSSGGVVRRSTGYDPRNRHNPTAYTSLIIDAKKP